MASLDTEQLNETFDLLTHPYRRYALYYLMNESETVSISTLATAIAAWSTRSTTARRTEGQAIETTLRHIHLPKLASAGIIALGEHSGDIELETTGGLGDFLADTMSLDGYGNPSIDD